MKRDASQGKAAGLATPRRAGFASAADVFLRWKTLPRVLVDHGPDWREITRRRGAEGEQHAGAAYQAPEQARDEPSKRG